MFKKRSALEIARWSALAAVLHGCNVNGSTPKAQLSNGDVVEADIASGAVDNRVIAANAVGTTNIQAGAITGALLSPSISISTTGNIATTGTGTITSGGNFSVGAGLFTVAAASGQTSLTDSGILAGSPALTIAGTTTQTGAGTLYGISNTLTSSPAASQSAALYAFSSSMFHTTAQNNTASETAGYYIVNNQNSGTQTAGYGSQSWAQNSSSGTITQAIGSLGVAYNSNNGSLVTGYGVSGQVQNSSTGTITGGNGVDAEIVNTSTGIITTGYGVRTHLTNSGGGTVTTYHGLHMDDPGTGYAAGVYNIYSAGTVYNYVAGRLGIGQATPSYTLDINGTARFVGLAAPPAANQNFLCLDTATGQAYVTATACNALSDRRLKTNIKTLDGALEKVVQLRGVSYDWKDEKSAARFGHQIGVIAQEVQKVFPEAVDKNPNGFFSVNFQMLVGPLVQAVKELHAKWSADHAKLEQNDVKLGQLEKKIELENLALKAENKALKERLDKIELALAQTAPAKPAPGKGRKLASK